MSRTPKLRATWPVLSATMTPGPPASLLSLHTLCTSRESVETATSSMSSSGAAASSGSTSTFAKDLNFAWSESASDVSLFFGS